MSAAPSALEPPPVATLLGPPELRGAAGPVPLRAERPHLLLAFLAARRTWVPRDALADWLYPGRELEAARSNLRKVLFLARRLGIPGAIEQRGDLLRWAPPTDLQRFEDACNARRWADAVAAYGGPLLQGLEPAWPAGAGDWLEAERQRLQARWQEACTRRLAELAGDPGATRALAEAMLRLDPLDDVALEALGRAQQALGQREAGLQAIAGYAQRLAAIGLEPSAAVAQLQRDLRGAAPPPTAPAGLVGRRQELAALRDRLAQPDCRLLTLLGPPGVGKSALARAAAAEFGGTWVPLEDLERADALPERIARALGQALDARAEPWQALARALAARPVLLVLDNAEHLALGEPLRALLQAVPDLRVLATSHAPLRVAGEWRQPLEGLPLPDADETDVEVLRANDAVRLFELRARPLAPAFDLGAEAADVVRLLHEVEGLPLAIELLAAWRRLMPVREILAELAASLDLLDGSAPGERSVRASFARAWQQLGPAEQRLLAQLSLLPAPVDRPLVRQVLQAPLPALALLVDRSLLQATRDGRFALHPLIRRCAAPLADGGGALFERHARHVAQRLAAGHDAAVDETGHLRAAWHWALRQGDTEALAQMADGYLHHLSRAAQYRDALVEFEPARRQLEPRVPDGGPLPAGSASATAALALGRVQVALAFAHYSLGQLDATLAAAAAALRLGERLQRDELTAAALIRQGAVHWQRGDYETAGERFQRLIDGLDPADTERRQMALGWMSLVHKALGRYAEAAAGYERSIAARRADGRLADSIYLLNNQGNLLRLLGRHAEALAILHQGLELARSAGQRGDEPFLLTNIALVLETRGPLAEALPWAGRAVASGQEHGEPMIEAAARLVRARLLAALGQDPVLARADLQACLAIAERIRGEPLRVQCLASAGLVLAHAGRRADGLALAAWAEAHPAFTRPEREDLQRHLARLALQPGEWEAARAALPPDTPAGVVQARFDAAGTP